MTNIVDLLIKEKYWKNIFCLLFWGNG